MRPATRLVVTRALSLTVASVLLACSSCKSAPPEDAVDAGVAATGILTPEQASQVLAHVGSRTITLGDFEAALEHMDQFDRMRYQVPERRKELLADMIDVMLLSDEARDKGYDKDPATVQEVREVMRDALLKKAREGLPAPNEIPPDEVRAYYEAHRAEFQDPERRRVSAIVVSSEAAASALLESARKATAAQFGELVRAKSIDPSARANAPADLAGDFGFVSPAGDPRGGNQRVPEPVRAAVFEVEKVGEVLPRVVEAGGKYYIVKLAARTEGHVRTLEEAERQIRVKVAQDKVRQREDALLGDLRKQFPVKIDEAALSQVRVDLPAVDAGGGAR